MPVEKYNNSYNQGFISQIYNCDRRSHYVHTSRLDTYIQGFVAVLDNTNSGNQRNTDKVIHCGVRSRRCGNACVPVTKRCRTSNGSRQSHDNPPYSTLATPRTNLKLIQRRVNVEENKIRNLSYERAVAIDPASGRVRFNTGDRGNATSIDLTDKEMNLMKGAIVTHNHPNLGWDKSDPRSLGLAFSEADVHAACKAEVQELRACSYGYNHSLRPKAKWNELYYQISFAPTYRHHEAEVYDNMVSRILNRKISSKQAEADFSHEVMRRTAKDLGLSYSRIKIH